MNKVKKGLIVLLSLLLCIPSITVSANETIYGYSPEAAAAYAEQHFDDGIGLCDEFVKDCLRAGGVAVRAGGVQPLMEALVDAQYGELQELVLADNNYHINKQDNPSTDVGDIMFFYCTECKKYIHTAIIGSMDEEGNFQAYGHNPAWDKVDWFGNFTHTLDDGTRHSKCSKYYVVNMDAIPKIHQHSFMEDLYESAHPHKMYDECSCGVKYYLGWNATVSSCTTCHPPVSSKPILDVTYNSEKGRVELSWTTVSNAINYEIYRAKTIDGQYWKLGSVVATSYKNSSVEDGMTYYYKVKAIRENVADSVESDIVKVTIGEVLTSLEAVNVQISNDLDTGIPKLSWNKVAGAVKYEVYRSKTENGTYTNVFSTEGSTYTHSSATIGQTYYYKVRAIADNKNIYSDSVIVEGVKKCPRVVLSAGYNATSGKPRMTWSKVDGAETYKIYRSDSKDGVYKLAFTTTGTAFTNTSVEDVKTYYYKAVAISSKGDQYNSAYSEVISITAKKQSTAPTVTDMGKQESGKPRIKWTSVSGATKYEIYRRVKGTGTFTKVYTSNYLSYTNTSAVGGTEYEYYVKAVFSNGSTGDASNIVTVMCYAGAPIVSDMGRQDSGKPRIKWSSVSGATKYEIYRRVKGTGTFTKVYTSNYLSYTNTSAVGGTEYEYYVVPILSNGTVGQASNTISVTCYCQDPVVTIAYNTSNGKPQIKWKAVSGATQYVVYRSVGTDDNYVKMYTTKYVSYTNTSVVSGTTYYYKVQAISPSGNANSDYSNVVSITAK